MTKKLLIKDCHLLAQSRGGKFLSTEYFGTGENYEWQCAKGHVWHAKHYNISAGGWCPECAGLKKKSIEDCNKIAESKGGKCLSSQYINSRTNLIWECAESHVFHLSHHAVHIQKRWCKDCKKLKNKSK
jgi:hypothetical protein